MKGLLLFDSVNDLVFLKTDKPLQLHFTTLAIKEGLWKDDYEAEEMGNLKKDIIIQLFAPLLASFKVMQGEIGDKYQSLEDVNGISIAFKEHLNHIIIGISKTKDIQLLQRELCIFSVYITMLYGPSLYLMKEPLVTPLGFARSQMLSLLVDKWHQLRTDLQMFLVEAVERLVVSPEVTATCVKFLQDSLHKVRTSHKEGIFSHSFLLVDCKLLALYSSRNAKDLPKEQLLLLILLANVLKTGSLAENESRDDIENDNKENDKDSKIQSLLVFLKTARGKVMPHTIYVIGVSERVTLIILCEMTGMGTMSNHLAILAEKLNNLQLHPSDRLSLPSFRSLDSIVKSLLETSKKTKLHEEKNKYLRNIVSKWEQVKRQGIEEYLQSANEERLKMSLESSISSACEACKTAFGEVIIRPELMWEEMCLIGEYKEVFLSVWSMAQKQLKDCMNYLESDVSENILLSSCLEDFPGLVNFIYIDRSNDCIVAQSPVLPSMPNEAVSFKKKVWEMVEFGWEKVDGVDSFFCLWHKDQLRYFYSLWFEDSSGKRIIPSGTPKKEDLPRKGILCGNFYKILVEKCFPGASHEHIYCFELFCTHVETTAAADVLDQARHLSVRLWEYSGACKTPLDLL